MLLTASTCAKHCSRGGIEYKGVLTSEEAFSRAEQEKCIVVISDNDYFFFSDDHCFGVNVLDETQWCPCTSNFPMYVAPREGLEDGYIDTVAKYIKVLCKDMKQITSIGDLVDLLNTRNQKDCA